jgi:hypothetical protein
MDDEQNDNSKPEDDLRSQWVAIKGERQEKATRRGVAIPMRYSPFKLVRDPDDGWWEVWLWTEDCQDVMVHFRTREEARAFVRKQLAGTPWWTTNNRPVATRARLTARAGENGTAEALADSAGYAAPPPSLVEREALEIVEQLETDGD